MKQKIDTKQMGNVLEEALGKAIAEFTGMEASKKIRKIVRKAASRITRDVKAHLKHEQKLANKKIKAENKKAKKSNDGKSKTKKSSTL